MGYYGNQPATGENNSFRVLDDLSSYTLTFDGSSAGVVSTANSTLTVLNHRFVTGQRVTYNDGGGTAIGGLSDGVYYVTKVSKDTIKLADSYANAVANSNITFSGLGVGSSHTLNVAFDGVNTRFTATHGGGNKSRVTRPAQLQISINGVIQQPVDSTTPSTGFGVDGDSVIVFSTAPSSSDVFWGYVVANNATSFDMADNTVDTFTGDGSTLEFTLSKAVANNQNALVTLDGVVQYPSDATTTRAYTITANIITFASAPALDVDIQVRHIGFAGATSSAVTGFYGRTGNAALQATDDVTVGTLSATSISGTAVTFTTGTFSGNVSIAGTLTYEDVSNIDSVGIITARDTIDAQGNVTVGAGLSVVGVSTLSNVVVGGATTEVVIDGDLRVTGIITTGTGSITFDGNNNSIIVGSGVTIYGNTGIISATSGFKGKLLGTPEIGAIDSSISDTAVDVFVYDTRKDSDGGAWRKRTQHTSWYNETLNTSTRGSRREFPAVAVIVAESAKVTIYDGDDPDLPMWMVFTFGMIRSGVQNTNVLSAVSMLNGVLFTATGSDSNNNPYSSRIDFLKEECKIWGNSRYYVLGGIVSRNSGYTFQSTTVFENIVNKYVNDVAMTVLPNAPIDSATGLPVPTIAVGTNDGVSVIRDDGSVISTTSSSGGYHIKKIAFTEEYGLNAHIDSSSGSNKALVYVKNFESINGLTYASYANWDGVVYANRYQTNVLTYITPSNGSAYPVSDFISMSERDGAIGSNFSEGGLTLLEKNNEDAGNGIVAFATTSYNTGWMHGNIKGAFLSDTDTTNATDSNVVTNGTFDSNTSGWFGDSGASISWDSGGFASVGNGGGDNTFAIAQSGILVSGAKYRVTGRVQPSMSGSYTFRVRAGGSSVQWSITSGLTNGQWYSFDTGIITADGTVLEIGSEGGTITNFYLDDVYVWKLEEEDRSVNNTGLEVHGTVTKSAVATGAELVAYSGWSASNYLIQPYNSGLDFGTGDWCYMFWYNPNDAESGDVLFTRWSYNINNSTAGRIGVYFNSGNLRVDLTDDGASSYQGVFGSDGSQDTNTWHLGCIIRRGANVETWVNAVRYGNSTLTSVSDGSYTNTSAILEIGNSPNMGAADSGIQLALLRASASAPSPEQIKKMYEDEKVLFQENAACTLYGSSDAVTALAYDDSSNILYAGTSSGRSDFQGLRRINNTTTAVTTAMSASNGLVAEQ